MSIFDRIFGNPSPEPAAESAGRRPARSEDEIAVERYRYLLRTAPPETIEQVHAEAFAKLTEEQRTLLFTELTENAPAGEAPRSSEPAALATAATRAEMRQPGTMERTFQGPSFVSMMGASLLGTVAGYVVASALVGAFLPDAGAEPSADAADGGAETGADASADTASGDSGADAGGDFGDFGGDFGF
ncbi:MAG: hypothetical protein LH471_02330 [Salinibacterium sp.]|nr:hypothetical protein [Salinibacterium sp.]